MSEREDHGWYAVVREDDGYPRIEITVDPDWQDLAIRTESGLIISFIVDLAELSR